MRKVPLTKGEFAIVDDEDFEFVSKHKWQVNIRSDGRKYAETSLRVGGRRIRIGMHRLVLWHASERTDHKNGDGLDNQKANLRPATAIQNGQNRRIQKHSSIYKGISYNNAKRAVKKWKSRIHVDGKATQLGSFSNPRDAAIAYDEAALKYHGEFARTNKQMGVL